LSKENQIPDPQHCLPEMMFLAFEKKKISLLSTFTGFVASGGSESFREGIAAQLAG
jgi:hypothetical protein